MLYPLGGEGGRERGRDGKRDGAVGRGRSFLEVAPGSCGARLPNAPEELLLSPNLGGRGCDAAVLPRRTRRPLDPGSVLQRDAVREEPQRRYAPR